MMADRVSILKEKTLYQGWSTLKEYLISYLRADGKKEEQLREIYNSGDGAAILLYNLEARKMILIRQFRLPVLLNNHPSGFILECCAGMLDDLNPTQAIIKEVEEETGLAISKVTKIYEAFATPGAHMEKIHFYVAEYDESNRKTSGGGDTSEQEDIEVLEYDFDQIPNMLTTGQIIDAKTIILLQWACIKFDMRSYN